MSTIHSFARAQAQEHLYAIRRAARAGRAVAAMMAGATTDENQSMDGVSAHDMGALVELLSEQIIASLDGMDAITATYSPAAA
jgi:hypothetical protein